MVKLESRQFDYARDQRTNAEYEAYYKAGLHNQQVAIIQFCHDQILLGKKIDRLQAYPDEWTEENWSYKPDYRLTIDGVAMDVEVKVILGHLVNLEIKHYQLDHLLKKPNSHLLICSGDDYCFIEAKSLVPLMGKPEPSKYFGPNKKVYNFEPSILPWDYWLHRPEFVPYPKHNK